LKTLSDVESATLTSPTPAPTSAAILSPMRCGRSIQPAEFQLRMRPSPHSRDATSASRAGVRRGSAPSELPSR
jgi:hypothetical protein